MDNDYNLILDTDSYKGGHHRMYPPGITAMTHYLEARVSEVMAPAILRAEDLNETQLFGLQAHCKRYLAQRVHPHDVLQAKEIFEEHGVSFPFDDWMYIAKDLHGKLPVEIWAPPEGSVIPRGNLLMKVRSTDPRVPWIGSWLETQLVRQWAPNNVTTISRKAREIIMRYLELTSDDPKGEIHFKLHCFGGRGATCYEQAAIHGAAHLVNFLGTDTLPGVMYARKHYNERMAGYSIDAYEHSTVTSWGESFEVEAYRNGVRNICKPGKTVAFVSDSYDIYAAVEHLWGGELRQEVIDSGATIVIRPDSGDPATTCLALAQILGDKFGTDLNRRQYRVLRHVRLIQGDGMDLGTMHEPYAILHQNGWSATNLAEGMGSGMMQKHDRDTQRVAYKLCEITRNGKHIPIFKNPKSDPSKRSKGGDLDLIRVDGKYKTVDRRDPAYEWYQSELVPFFSNGVVLRDDSLFAIRERAWGPIS